jgi:hypothetical protein
MDASGGIVSHALGMCRGLAVGEAVEGRVHDLGRHPPQRRGAAGEVAVPVGAVAERGHLLVALVGEVGDQADRLE